LDLVFERSTYLLGQVWVSLAVHRRNPFVQQKNWLLVSLLSLTVFGAIWMYFIPHLATVSIWVVLFSPVTIINGTSEEILWRGVYVKAFGKHVF
jgi:membrane protease YdiL (CAAX protease family)